jgi:energy-coupling factor transport system permease protein
VTRRDRSSPLHAARAGVGAAWCAVLGAVALAFEHPVVLGAVLLALLGAAAGAGVLRPVGRALVWGLPFALVIALVNPLVVRDGVTVVFRGGELPWLGAFDVTAEALAYGAILGLRALAVTGCAALLAAAVDPDALLRALRRASLRSGVTAAVATRLVPVLARDARRLADAQRCLPGAGASRPAVLRAVTAGALDRATDVAATLELRGFGTAGRPARDPRPWSRHDLAFALSAAGLAAVAVAARLGDWARFAAYPQLSAPLGPGPVLLAAALVLLVLVPFADRRGIVP